MSRTNRRWLLTARPAGAIKQTDFVRVEEPAPTPRAGECLVRVTHLSFDPTQRGWISEDTYVPAVPIGGVVRALAVGQVVESSHPAFAVGQLVQGAFGWQDYAITDGTSDIMAVSHVPSGVTPAQALGVFGLTGLTAYFGLHEIGKPEPGETVLVSGAAGATGSVAVQLAKAAGCRVIGIAGGGDDPRKQAGVRFLLNLAMRRARMEGLIVLDYEARYAEARAALAALIAAGELHSAEDVQHGFENIPATLSRLFEGKNLGKQLLELAEPPLPV